MMVVVGGLGQALKGEQEEVNLSQREHRHALSTDQGGIGQGNRGEDQQRISKQVHQGRPIPEAIAGCLWPLRRLARLASLCGFCRLSQVVPPPIL